MDVLAQEEGISRAEILLGHGNDVHQDVYEFGPTSLEALAKAIGRAEVLAGKPILG